MRTLSSSAALAAVLLVAASAAGSPLGEEAASPPPRLELPYTQFTLPNGLNVILHEDHRIPVVAVNVWYHTGSARETPGRTGFAHLFEHIMFEGSGHVGPGEFDNLLEAVGGDNNGSTEEDRTNYWENLPSNALDLALFLESDRMGYLLDVMSPARVDQQRGVVKNERRQSYENHPYGVAFLRLPEELFPPDHPYHWPVIGSMEDLTAARHEDVVDFFKSWYGPDNASLAIAGDIDPAAARRQVAFWFSDVPRGAPVAALASPPAVLRSEKRVTLEDRVQLPRLYVAWLTPAIYRPADAALDVLASILADGKNSRLYKRLVYDLGVAQDVSASQESNELSSIFLVTVTARAGHDLTEMEKLVEAELDHLRAEPPTAHEMERATNRIEANFYRSLERIGGFGGKADRLNSYYFRAGRPDYTNEDLARYRALNADDIASVARRELPKGARVLLSVVPEGHRELAAAAKPSEARP